VTDAPDAPPPPPTAATPANGADRAATAAPVLARGHLHPGILLLRLLDALRQAAFPVVAGLVLQSWWFVGFGVLGYVLRKLKYPLAPLVLALVRGDHMVSEIKLQKIAGLGAYRLASEAEIVAHLGCVPGFIGPVAP
jgi:TctA family transporter